MQDALDYLEKFKKYFTNGSPIRWGKTVYDADTLRYEEVRRGILAGIIEFDPALNKLQSKIQLLRWDS